MDSPVVGEFKVCLCYFGYLSLCSPSVRKVRQSLRNSSRSRAIQSGQSVQAGTEEGKTFRLPALAHTGPPKTQTCSHLKGWVCRVDISIVWEHQVALSALSNAPFKLNGPHLKTPAAPLSPTAPSLSYTQAAGVGGHFTKLG